MHNNSALGRSRTGGYASSPQRAQLLFGNGSGGSMSITPNARTPSSAVSTRVGGGGSSYSGMRQTHSARSGPATTTRTASSNNNRLQSQASHSRTYGGGGSGSGGGSGLVKGGVRRVAGTGTADGVDQSTQVLKQRLESLTGVRKQLEQLALRHRKEEEGLAKAMSSIVQKGETETKTRGELLQLVEERNRAIRMLDKFRQDGTEVTRRMHSSLQHSQQQNDELIQQLRMVADENDRLRRAGQQGGAPHSPGGGGGYSPRAEDPRVPQYQRLLADADDMLRELKVRNEQLSRKVVDLEAEAENPSTSRHHHHQGSGSPVGGAQDPAEHEVVGEGGAQTPSLEPTDLDEAKQVIKNLRDQLKLEKASRLEAEEFSSKVMTEHRKSVALLEQRVARQQDVAASPVQTPRRSMMAGGGGGVPGNRTPIMRAATIDAAPNRSQRMQGFAHEVPADPSPEPTPKPVSENQNCCSTTSSVENPQTPLEAVLRDEEQQGEEEDCASEFTAHHLSLSPLPIAAAIAATGSPIVDAPDERRRRSGVSPEITAVVEETDGSPEHAGTPSTNPSPQASPQEASPERSVSLLEGGNVEAKSLQHVDYQSSGDDDGEGLVEGLGDSSSSSSSRSSSSSSRSSSSSAAEHQQMYIKQGDVAETDNFATKIYAIEEELSVVATAAAADTSLEVDSPTVAARRSGSAFDHAQAMQELELLESQLAEVAAELGET